jgi:hypothetical protein
MEIRSPGLDRIQKNTGPLKKDKKSAVSGFADTIDEPSLAAVQHSNIVFSVDPMFANLDEPSPEQKGIQKGLSLLDELDKFRSQLVSGHVSIDTISDIQDYVQQLQTHDLDENLQGLLLEIETRAVVELAKYRMRGKAL